MGILIPSSTTIYYSFSNTLDLLICISLTNGRKKEQIYWTLIIDYNSLDKATGSNNMIDVMVEHFFQWCHNQTSWFHGSNSLLALLVKVWYIVHVIVTLVLSNLLSSFVHSTTPLDVLSSATLHFKFLERNNQQWYLQCHYRGIHSISTYKLRSPFNFSSHLAMPLSCRWPTN